MLYPEGRRHSPITASVASRLQAIAATAPHAADVFAKIGDSNTAAAAFLGCFDGGPIDLGTNAALAPTVDFFLHGNAAGVSPYARTSLAAVGGTTAREAMLGTPSPFDRELTEIDPRLGVIMFGTNDVRFGRTLDEFGSELWTLVDLAIGRGVVPILSTIPPINGDPGSDARIPTFNRIIRAIAQGRGVPLTDLHRDLVPLANRGLVADGLHLTVATAGACVLTAAGLQAGYNVRNLVTIEALDRTRGALAGTASDASATTRSGSGHTSTPFVGSLPLVDLGDSRDGDALFASYGCGGPAQLGRELVYRFDVASARTIVASVVDRGAVNVDVHILAGSLSASACVASGGASATATVGPGTVYVVVDAQMPGFEGEYLLAVE